MYIGGGNLSLFIRQPGFCSLLCFGLQEEFPFPFVDGASPLVTRYTLPTGYSHSSSEDLHSVLGVGGEILKAPLNSRGQAL